MSRFGASLNSACAALAHTSASQAGGCSRQAHRETYPWWGEVNGSFLGLVNRPAIVIALLALAGCGGGGGTGSAPAAPQSTGEPSPASPTPAANATSFDVRTYGARCDGHTDDATAIQAAEQAAARAAQPGHGTVVVLPAGTCAMGGPVAWDSNVSLNGAGMNATTLTALASFTYDPSKVRVGPGGREIGMIWLDGPTATGPIENVSIQNVGFDPRAGTQNWTSSTGIRLYQPISCYERAVHNLTVQHVYFELGANPTAAYTSTGTEGPKAFVGVQLTQLGVDPLDPSHDLVFNDVHAHNGDGMLRFVLSGSTKNGVTSSFYNLTVENEYDTVDLDNIEDDRIEIDGSTAPYAQPLTGAPLGSIKHLVFQNINVTVAPSVTVGSINAIRLNSSFNTEIDDVSVNGVTYVGSPSGYGPIVDGTMHQGTGSVISMNTNDVQGYIDDLSVQNINAQYTLGVGMALGAPAGQPLVATLANVVVQNAFVYGGVTFVFSTPTPTVRNPNGPYDVTISNVQLSGSPQNALNPASTPLGIDFHRHVATAGDGDVLLQNVTVTGFGTPLLIEPGFDGMVLDNVHWTGTAEIGSKVTEQNSGPTT